MLFFVKTGRGLVVMEKEAGAILRPSVIADMSLSAPTLEQLSTMTGDALTAFPKQVGLRVTNALCKGKDGLAQFLHSHWQVYADRAMEVTTIRALSEFAKGKIFFVENTFGFSAITVKSGMIMSLGFLNAYNNAVMERAVLEQATMQEMKNMITDTFEKDAKEKKKKDLMDRIEVLFQQKRHESDQMFRNVLCSDSEDDSSDSDSSNFPDDMFPVGYLEDPSDFGDDTDGFISVKVRDNHQLVRLMVRNVPIEATVAELKDMIVDTAVKTKGVVLRDTIRPDDFVLRCEGIKMDEEDKICDFTDEGALLEVVMGVKLRGGAPKTIKSHLKKNIKTTTSDGGIFAGLHQACMLASSSSSYDFKGGLKELSPSELLAMKDELKPSRVKNDIKIDRMVEHLRFFKTLNQASERIVTAMQTMKELATADIAQKYATDDGDIVDVLRELIVSVIAEKAEGVTSAPSAMMEG